MGARQSDERIFICLCAGVPSAIGAKMVKPDHAVIAVVGDGGFMMNSQVRLAVTTTLHNAQN